MLRAARTFPISAGRCAKHHREYEARRALRHAAITALHKITVDDAVPTHAGYRDEIARLSRLLDEINIVRTHRVGRPHIPLDEADDAAEWCVALAEQLVEAERNFRQGKEASYMLDATREWVWNRFDNLQAGLRSNGLPRA